jgi:hypothetical protein
MGEADMWSCIGKIPVSHAGTPVRVTSVNGQFQTIFFQQVDGNLGKLHICSRATAQKTGSGDNGILAVIPAPTYTGGVATVLPYAAVTIPNAPGALNPANFWIDTDNDNEACQVSGVYL